MIPCRRDVVRFDGYRFDLRRLTLANSNGPVALRPKTACLLALFLRRSDCLLSKADIIGHVWQRAHVQDQSLFQAVSELRRVLAPLEPITTQPNQGYRWNRPVRRHQPLRLPLALAASAVLTVGMAAALVGSGATSTPSAASMDQWPPSLRAFGSGMRQLEQSRVDEAQRYFVLALRENPAFDEARLMLAETLFAQGRVDEARAQASELLQSPLEVDAYTTVSAMSLMGRSQSAEGNPARGLNWVLAAAQQARDEGFACAAASLEDRITTLMATNTAANVKNIAPIAAGSSADLKDTAARPAYCQQIDAVPGGPGAHLDPDGCFAAPPTRRKLV